MIQKDDEQESADMRQSPAEFNHPAFKTMDTNKDGAATLNEFKRMCSDQFGGLDQNSDGAITADEM
jgi:Ca2+-binding EF-hand superfamily protein